MKNIFLKLRPFFNPPILDSTLYRTYSVYFQQKRWPEKLQRRHLGGCRGGILPPLAAATG
jgi:hypothetical protein